MRWEGLEFLMIMSSCLFGYVNVMYNSQRIIEYIPSSSYAFVLAPFESHLCIMIQVGKNTL